MSRMVRCEGVDETLYAGPLRTERSSEPCDDLYGKTVYVQGTQSVAASHWTQRARCAFAMITKDTQLRTSHARQSTKKLKDSRHS